MATIALLVGILMSADAADDATKSDLERFQGNWILISAERDGKKIDVTDKSIL